MMAFSSQSRSRSYDDDHPNLENTQNKRLDAAQCLTCRTKTKEFCLRCKKPFCSIDCVFKGYSEHESVCITSSRHSSEQTHDKVCIDNREPANIKSNENDDSDFAEDCRDYRETFIRERHSKRRSEVDLVEDEIDNETSRDQNPINTDINDNGENFSSRIREKLSNPSKSAKSSTNRSSEYYENRPEVSGNNKRISSVELETRNRQPNCLTERFNERVDASCDETEIYHTFSKKMSLRPEKRITSSSHDFTHTPEYLTRKNRVEVVRGEPIELKIMFVGESSLNVTCMCMIKDEIPLFRRMMNDLQNKMMTTYCPLRNLKNGWRCLVSLNEKWYRATIRAINPIMVELVDKSFSKCVNSKDLNEIPTEYLDVRPFSFPIKIFRITQKQLKTLQEKKETIEVIPLSKKRSEWTVKPSIKMEKLVLNKMK